LIIPEAQGRCRIYEVHAHANSGGRRDDCRSAEGARPRRLGRELPPASLPRPATGSRRSSSLSPPAPTFETSSALRNLKFVNDAGVVHLHWREKSGVMYRKRSAGWRFSSGLALPIFRPAAAAILATTPARFRPGEANCEWLGKPFTVTVPRGAGGRSRCRFAAQRAQSSTPRSDAGPMKTRSDCDSCRVAA